jgi:hypothetical protein
MDFNLFNLLVAVVGLIVMAYTAHLTRRQVRMTEANAVVVESTSAPMRRWWRAPTFLAVAFMAFLTWVPWIYGMTHHSAPKTEVWYGELPDRQLYVTIDLKEEKPDRKVAVVVFHYYGTTDAMDQIGLQKSKLFDYRSGLRTILIQPDNKFIQEAVPGRVAYYYLISVPTGVSEDQFSTLRQAEKFGAELIYLGGKS